MASGITVLPFLFNHAGVTGGLRSGKETVMNGAMRLRVLHHGVLKTNAKYTSNKHRKRVTPGDRVGNEQGKAGMVIVIKNNA